MREKIKRDKNSTRNFLYWKKPINNWDVNVDSIVISKLLETKTNSKYIIGYLDKVMRPIVLILPKISGYVKIFKVKDGDKDKNNKLMSFRVNNENLYKKYKTIWTKIEESKKILDLMLYHSMMKDI